MQKTTLPSTIGKPATNAHHAHGIYNPEDLNSISEENLKNLHGVRLAIKILNQAYKRQ